MSFIVSFYKFIETEIFLALQISGIEMQKYFCVTAVRMLKDYRVPFL